MLRGIRTASTNWLGRIVMGVLLGLIALSFAVWGVGDVFRGFGQSTVATVGSTELTIEQFRQVYNDRLQALGRRIGRPITQQQAREWNIEGQVVRQIVSEAALDERARQLRLNLTDAEISRSIMGDPAFQNAGGQFDRIRFEQGIRNAGYNEARYAVERRRELLRREITETVTGVIEPPRTALEALGRYQNEQRALDFIVLDSAKAGEIPVPTPEELAKYFEERKALFRAPEFRAIDILQVAPADVAKTAEVSDADAQKFYEANKNRFGAPEQRQIEQIVFPNMEEARAAKEKLDQGTTFAALAAERKLNPGDIDLGLIAKSGIVDPAIADAAFALKEGEVSAPVQGRFGVAIVRVARIQPETIKPFQEVADQVKQTIAVDRARAEIGTLHDKIEDERGAGLKLAEIAPKLNLKLAKVEAVDRSGRGPDGNPVTTIPNAATIVQTAFTSDIGFDNDPVQLPGGGYVWFEVTGITPSRERTLEEVQSRLAERWRDEQIAERLKAKATEMLEKAKSGTALADLAAAEGLRVETTFGLKRGGATAGALSAKVVETAFNTPKGAVAMAEGRTPTEWVLFRVTDVTVPTLDANSEEMRRIETQVRNAMAGDLLGQYVQRLQTEVGTKINAQALGRALGTITDQPN
jgi:peptidyl-prolyl cis-trans isomerase D